MVSSFAFLDWQIDDGPPAIASAPRSKVVAALLQGTRRPTLLEHSRLEDVPFISSEVLSTEASRWATELATTDAFKTVYKGFRDWEKVAKTFTAHAGNPDNLLLREDSFTEIEAWDSDKGPSELLFLARTSIADLINADSRLSDEAFQPRCLSRAFLIMGSKDNQTERDDESSVVRLASEQITAILKREMRNSSPSAAGMASRFCSMMRDVKLPPIFCMHAFSAQAALREFELAYNYAHASATEISSIEAELFLNVGESFPIFKPLLERFDSGPAASADFNRLAVQLLPASLTSSPNLVRLPALSELLGRASWRATVTHLLNTNGTISGPDLISSLITSHTEVAEASSAGGPSTDSEAVGTSGISASYGSIRDQSIGDALRSTAATEALSLAENQSGIERVETIVQSKSVLLTRAELLQEAWLHNKHATLAFCSLDQPYLCPYFASVLTEDKDSGLVHDRLQAYTFPLSELNVLRSRDWSKLDLIGQALNIRQFQYGTPYAKVRGDQVYVVESSLRVLRDYGSRLFFALNLGLDPTAGYAFTDGVDLQLAAVDFANSLPKAECTEWLTFLTNQFKKEWLDAGGIHYHSKLRSGRPDAPEAQLSEFLPTENAFFRNVKSRMRRAEPVADFRAAFPSMFSSGTVSLPGTLAAGSQGGGKDKGGGGDGGNGGGNGGKGGGKGADKKRLFDADAKGPGSKSKLAMSISTSELWLGGVVFKLPDIAQHFKVPNPDHVCWPVLLSKKKGDEALEICPDHSTHGNIKQAVHTRPANFDLSYIYKHFTRAATAGENKKAGWDKPNGKKKSKA